MNGKKKRIVIIGSVPRSLVNFRGALVKTLVDEGFEVHAVAPGLRSDSETADTLESLGVTIHDVPMQRTGLNPIYDFQSLWALYKLLRQLKPDAVLGYTIKPVIYGMMAAGFAKVPGKFALITGLGYAFTGKASGKRRIIQRVVCRLYRASLAISTKAIFQNPDDESLFRKLKLLPDTVSSTVINGSGIDTRQFHQAPLPAGSASFLLIARLLGDKGVREYIEAARRLKAEHPTISFRLVGDLDTNPDAISQQELDEWIDSQVVDYLGKLSDVRPAIEEASVYVLPSYREGTPRTVLEAMSMGRPIVTTDAPGCRETVKDGDNGFLVPVKDATTLALVMKRFIEQPGLITRMGERSRVIAEEKYDVHKVNESIMNAMGLA